MMKMNSFVVLSMLTFLPFSFLVEAKKSKEVIPYMEVKCYVEYGGGKEDIRYISARYKHVNEAKRFFQGRQYRDAKDTLVINKVMECRKAKERFTNAKAFKLESELDR